MPTFKLERLTLNDSVQAAIVNLRKSEFHSKFQSDVDVQGLEWNRNDAASTHFGAWSGDGKLASILRLTNVETPGVFEANMMFPADDLFSEVPCGLLARAATASGCRGKNLGMALRTMAYGNWLAEGKARYLFGTALARSSRLPMLAALGYEFKTNPKPWMGYLKSKDEAISIFRISRETLARELPRLQREYLDPLL